MLGAASDWKATVSAEGDMLLRGRMRILVDAHEIHILDENETWVNLILDEHDVARIQDVAYDMLHDPQWVVSQAIPVKIALDELDLM